MGIHGHRTSYILQKSTKDTTFSKDLSIVYTYSNISKLYEMEDITTEEVMEKLDIFQAIFERVY